MYIMLEMTPQTIVETAEQIAVPPPLTNRVKDDNIAVGIPIIGPPNNPATITTIIRMSHLINSLICIIIAVDKNPKIKKITMHTS